MAQKMNSRITARQAILVLAWLPVHLFVLPWLLIRLIPPGSAILTEQGMLNYTTTLHVLLYGIGALYMLVVLWRFFRDDFDPIWEHPFRTLLMVIGAYLLSIFGQTMVSLLLDAMEIAAGNENNEIVSEMAVSNIGPTAAMSVFLAPIVEESIFRAGVFGLLRRKSRVLAYLGSILLFGLYHVFEAALYDPIQLVFILQYVPPALALAYVYEKNDSIWASIFLHMLTNGVAMYALVTLQ